MAITKGKKVALYFLLSVDSKLRRALEGRTGPVSAPTAANPPGTAAEMVQRFKDNVGVGHFGLNQYPINLARLFVLGGGRNNVATDSATILAAMDGPYDPAQGPCPDIADENAIFASLDALYP